MKLLRLILAGLALASAATAQTLYKNVQKTTDGTNGLTENLAVPAGKTLDVSAGTLTLADAQVGWAKVNKTGSSLADLATRSASDLSSGTVPTARLYTTAAGYAITNGANLDSFAAITRAAGFDTFVATPSGANLASLLTTAIPASKGGTGLTSLSANVVSLLGAADYAAMRTQLSLVPGTDVQAYDAALAALAAGSDFVQFAGPTTSTKVFTLPDASSTLLYSGGPLGTPSSGTLTNATGLPTAGLLDDAVTFAKLQNIATDRLLGRDTALTGDPEEITVGGGLEFTGTGGIQRSALTGDATASAGSNAITLATVNSNVGTFGSATQASVVTVNAKGLVTAASNATVTPAVGSITGLGTGVGTALAVNTGTAGAFVVNGGALGTPSSGTATNLTGTSGITGTGALNSGSITSGFGSIDIGTDTLAAGAGSFTTLSASGLTTLSSKLTVTGASTGQTVSEFAAFDTTTTDLAIWRRSDSLVSYRLRYDSSGDMLFGSTTAHDVQIQRGGTTIGEFTSTGLAVTGNITGTGVYSTTTASAANVFVDSNGLLQRSTSSLRYKRDVRDYPRGLADVMKLRPVLYKGIAKADGDTDFAGLIAEEVDAAGLTEFVVYNDVLSETETEEVQVDEVVDGAIVRTKTVTRPKVVQAKAPDALAYANMVTLAFKAIQELKAENDALRARIEALEAK